MQALCRRQKGCPANGERRIKHKNQQPGAFTPRLLRFFGGGLVTFGGHHPQGVLQRGDDGREIFPGGFFAVGQIEDKTVPAGARHGAGKHGAGGVLQSLHPHGNGNGSDLPFEDAEGRFGGDVPGGKADAAGGDDQIKLFFIGAGGQLGPDGGNIIRHDSGMDDRIAGFLQHRADGGAAGIGALPHARAVADGDHCCGVCHFGFSCSVDLFFMIPCGGGWRQAGRAPK